MVVALLKPLVPVPKSQVHSVIPPLVPPDVVAKQADPPLAGNAVPGSTTVRVATPSVEPGPAVSSLVVEFGVGTVVGLVAAGPVAVLVPVQGLVGPVAVASVVVELVATAIPYPGFPLSSPFSPLLL